MSERNKAAQNIDNINEKKTHTKCINVVWLT